MQENKMFWPTVIQFPLTKVSIALFMVVIPVVLAQFLIDLLPLGIAGKNTVLVFCAALIIYGMYSLYVQIVEKRRADEFSLSGAWKEMGQGILLGAGLFSGVVAILALMGVYRVDGFNAPQVLLVPFVISVFTGIFEEVLMRGIFFRIIEESLGSWLALAISAIIFGLLHLLNENATLTGAVAIILEAGILLAAAFMLTRRLWFAIGIHFAWNFTQGGIFGIIISGNEPIEGILRSSMNGPDWLTGGYFGAEASVVAVVLCLLAGLYLIGLSIRKGNIIQPFWRKK